MSNLFEDPGVDEFRGLYLRNLSIDEAWLVITSHLEQPSWLYVLSDDCYTVGELLFLVCFFSINNMCLLCFAHFKQKSMKYKVYVVDRKQNSRCFLLKFRSL